MPRRFIPYGRQYIDDEDIGGVIKVLKSDWITTGPRIDEFEKALCKYTSAKFGVAVNSGTSALDIAIACLGLPKNSEIITTPFTFVATPNAILYNSHRPVFCDISEDTFNIDPREIKKNITKKTRAIVLVDFAGQPCDIEELREIAEENDLYLVEDSCHSLGAEYKNKKVGSLADITIFSFHPVKQITTGEGGMAVTNNEEHAEKMRMLRNHGIDIDVQKRFGPNTGYAYDLKLLGRNYRMTDFQAALGISQLKKLKKFIVRREEIVKTYNSHFKNIELITTPTVRPYNKSAHHLYTILLNSTISRDEFFNKMRELYIGVNVHYIPVYHHSYYKEHMTVSASDFRVSENVYKRILSLPLHQGLEERDIKYIVDSVKSLLKDRE